MRWDLFCRVVDNHGDAGVAWRLAADLAGRGESVRLWIDDASALEWMAPGARAGSVPGVQVRPWPTHAQPVAVGDVVIEAFGCELPDAVTAAMAACRPPPVWLNLEYLSAETYVERSHGLRSPQSVGPGAGLPKWFYYPGFTDATGGVLREPDLAARRSRFDPRQWLDARGWAPRDGEQVVVLFGYDNPALPQLADGWRARPTLLLACPGPSQRQLDRLNLPATVRRVDLPWLSQTEFDHLLWSADLNLVRGEDSFVRAMWAGQPFVWQAYPQQDGAHGAKVDAFLARFAGACERDAWTDIAALWRAWNGLAPWPDRVVRPGAAWRHACTRWRDGLQAQSDLCTRLLRFVAEKR